MAQKRMFNLKIVDTDAFLEMPASSQLLYFHLSMKADDDGFVSNPKRIMRMTGAGEDDIKVLFAKKFVIPFDSGICVIKHWWINNYIQNDRYTPTTYVEERKLLKIKENKAYTLIENENVSNLDTTCMPRLDQIRSDKIREDKKESRFAPPSLEELIQYCKDRGNQINPQSFIDFYESKGWLIGKNKMKDWRAAVRTWEARMPKVIKPEIFKAKEKPVTAEEIENRKKILAKMKESLKF